MSWARWIWNELTRPRGKVSHRFYRVGRSSRSGIAMLLVITTLLLMTVIVSEIQYAATVRLQLAAHQRNEAKAESLATSGVQMYRLILVASKMIGKNPMIQQYAGMLGVNGDSLWQMIPFINTGLMRMLFVSGGDMDEFVPDDDEERAELMQGAGEGGKDLMTEEQREESRDNKSSSEKSFLDFDGDFFAEVTDEESRINITALKATNQAELGDDPVAQRLVALMSGRENCPAVRENIDFTGTGAGGVVPLNQETENDHDQFFYDNDLERLELIANLADWVDADDSRIWQGGYEDSLYENLDDPYRSKNAPFDSMQEVRLIDGWNRDDVWERYGDKLTVYGSGKVNVNSAECEVLWALISAFSVPNDPNTIGNVMIAVETNRALGQVYTNPQTFVNSIESTGLVQIPNKQLLMNSIGTESNVFRVHSVGEVGKATVSIDAVIDFTSSQTGKVVYWRVQ